MSEHTVSDKPCGTTTNWILNYLANECSLDMSCVSPADFLAITNTIHNHDLIVLSTVPALVKALEDMFAAFDEPFRSKPMGAPGSHARARQAEQIAAWDAGKAALTAYREK